MVVSEWIKLGAGVLAAGAAFLGGEQTGESVGRDHANTLRPPAELTLHLASVIADLEAEKRELQRQCEEE